MKKSKKGSFLLLSSITLGLVTSTALVSCGQPQETVNAKKLTFNFNNVKGITTTDVKEKYGVGEVVSFKLKYNPDKILLEDVTLSNNSKLMIYGDEYKFIMPDEDIIVNVRCREKVDLKGKLQNLIDSRNYTVLSRINVGDEQYDTIALFTEDANMIHVENDYNMLKYGEINGEEGIYNYEIEEVEGVDTIVTTKTTYHSRKNNIKSYWDPRHEHGGFHKLDIKRVKDSDEVYHFKDVEFSNKTQVFYPTGLNFATFLSAIKDITVKINDNGNIQFDISLGDHGSIVEEITKMGQTRIPIIESYINKGGKAKPSVLTEEQQKTLDSLNTNNYREPLATVDYVNAQGENVTIQQGYIYYHPNYLYVDYTEEFLEYINGQESSLTFNDNGYIQVDDKVYEFVIYDNDGVKEFTVNENPDQVQTGKLPEVCGYFSTTNFIKNYAYANRDKLFVNQTQYILYDVLKDYDIGYECGEKTFHLDSNKVKDELLLQGSEGIGITDMFDDTLLVVYLQNGGAAAISYEKFGATKIPFIEEEIAKREAK